MLLLVRNPKGTLHTNRMHAPCDADEYNTNEDGELTYALWKRHYDKK